MVRTSTAAMKCSSSQTCVDEMMATGVEEEFEKRPILCIRARVRIAFLESRNLLS